MSKKEEKPKKPLQKRKYFRQNKYLAGSKLVLASVAPMKLGVRGSDVSKPPCFWVSRQYVATTSPRRRTNEQTTRQGGRGQNLISFKVIDFLFIIIRRMNKNEEL